jgi:hypothetical protein
VDHLFIWLIYLLNTPILGLVVMSCSYNNTNTNNNNKGGSISAKVEDWVKSNTKKGTWKQMYVMLVFFLCGVCFAPHEHHPELGVFL